MTKALIVRLDLKLKQDFEKHCAANNVSCSSLLRHLISEELLKNGKISHAFKSIEEAGAVNEKFAAFAEMNKHQFATLGEKLGALAFLGFQNLQETLLAETASIGIAQGLVAWKWEGKVKSEEATAALEILGKAQEVISADLAAVKKILTEFSKAFQSKSL
ncbi:hypothetical protein MUP01_07575 [Candidatus Bathyarchaeota archaeon]|nr:hypothetical protein [Candidatus Bathyarchaeota archaeon]